MKMGLPVTLQTGRQGGIKVGEWSKPLHYQNTVHEIEATPRPIQGLFMAQVPLFQSTSED